MKVPGRAADVEERAVAGDRVEHEGARLPPELCVAIEAGLPARIVLAEERTGECVGDSALPLGFGDGARGERRGGRVDAGLRGRLRLGACVRIKSVLVVA